MRIRILFLLLTLVLAAGIASAQTSSSRTNLTTILNQLSEKYNVKLSFSPNFTKEIFPKNTQIDGGVETALTRVLDGTGLAFRKMGSRMYYIYRSEEKKTPVKPKPKKQAPEKETPKPDTMRLHTVVLPIADSIRPIYNHKLTMPPIALHDLPLIAPVPVQPVENTPLPLLAVKSNLLYNSTTSMNLGVEIGLAPKWTLDISGNYNPWTFSDNRKMKHWLIQPEVRYWLCQRFSGHFFGLHAHYAQFNVGGMLPWGFNSGKMFGAIENKDILNHRYEGWLLGAGIGYGYHWILGNRWGLEAEIGVGYARIEYDKYRCAKCGEKLKSGHKNYFGPTKAAVTLIFMIK